MIYLCMPMKVERIWGSLPPAAEGLEPVGEIWWFHEGTVLKTPEGSQFRAAEFFPAGEFPVILKTLHSARDLSVQVHPGRTRVPPVKDESWVILEGEGRILHGVKEGVSPREFANKVSDGRVEEILETLKASPGDLFHLPAGTVHALGGGLTVLEIQLNCTITYRLWDYNRLDSSENPRELHIEQGLEAVDWNRSGRAVPVSGTLDTPSYSLRRIGPGRVELAPYEIAYDHLSGRCFFTAEEGGVCSTAGETWIVRIKK